MASPSMKTWPPVGASRPPARLSSVDLPEPLGPMTATSSPAWTSMLTPASARTAVVSLPWTRLTSASRRIGVVPICAPSG